MDTQTLFDQTYFEDGISHGVSCYYNYHWSGEPTLDYCDKVIEFLGLEKGETLLDFGCAKGFYTKAFRLLGIDAWGSDISEYALDNCDPDVEWWIHHDTIIWEREDNFDFLFSKDVFEHIKDFDEILGDWSERCEQALIGVPLGDDGKYRLPRAHNDITHIHCQNEEWWTDQFAKYYKGVNVYYKIPRVILREGDDPKGYGYFLCR